MTKKKRRPRVADLPPVVLGSTRGCSPPLNQPRQGSHLHGQREAHATWKEQREEEEGSKDSRARE